MAKLKDYIDKIEEVLAVSILAYMLVILSYQVVLRFVFSSSNAWSEELSRYLFVWFVYVTASLAVLKKAHIRIDAFLGIYPKFLQKVVVLIGYGIFLIYCVVIIYFSTLFTMQIYESEQISLGLEMPMWYVWLCLPVCHTLMALRLLQRLYHVICLGASYKEHDVESTS